MEALVPQPPTGRTFRVAYRIRLSDTDATGRLRLDAVARYLQDAAIDDVSETSWGAPEHLWVLRAVRIDVLAPFLADGAAVTGKRPATPGCERREAAAPGHDVGGGAIEVDSTWVHLGADARPARIGEGFEAYAEAAQGRATSTRLTLAAPDGGTRIGWPLRATDVDRMGHVNNAAYWAAVEQRLAKHELDLRLPHRARLDYRHPIDLGDDVELVETNHRRAYHAAFRVHDAVKAVVSVEPLVS